jgi:hypothetical protein
VIRRPADPVALEVEGEHDPRRGAAVERLDRHLGAGTDGAVDPEHQALLAALVDLAVLDS